MKKAFKAIVLILAVILAALTAAGLLYQPETRIPEGFAGRVVEVNGLRLRVLQEGTGSDVLLIHGCPGSIEDWAPLMDLLSKNHRVTAYDRPGYGFSGGTGLPYTLAHNAQTALGLIHVLGLKDVVVVGHSYGAATALTLALEKPPEAKSYVLVGVVPYGISEIDPLYHLLAVPGLGTGLARILVPALGPGKIREGLIKSFGPNAGEIPPGFVDLRVRLWSRPMVALSRAHEILNYNSGIANSIPRYQEIVSRMFLVEGAEEKYVSDARRLHEEIHDSEWTEIPNTGHEVPIVRAKELAAVIERAASQ